MNYISFDDAWIFLAMKYAENERADYYAAMFGFCVYINHAIPAYEEFIATYNKLLYVSLLKKEGDIAYISDFGNSVYLNAVKKSEPDASPRRLVEVIQAELKPYKLKSACRQSPISEQEYLAVIDRYKAKST
jgi:hypothetical protein